MDLKPKPYYKNNTPTAKIFALCALFLSFSIPFLLLKTVRDKQSTPENSVIELPLPPNFQTPNPLLQNKNGTALLKVAQTKEYRKKSTLKLTQTIATDVAQPNHTEITPPITQPQIQWKALTIKKGDSLASLFKQLGLSKQTLHSIIHDNPHAKLLASIKPDQKIQFGLMNQKLEKLVIPLTPLKSLSVYRSNQRYLTEINTRKVNMHPHYLTGTVQDSIYGTAKRLGIPYKLIHEMADIFNWEIDFSRDVRAGDQFTIVYNAIYIENKRVGVGEILAVTYRTRNKTHQAFRHQSTNGNIDYFNAQGQSLKKAFNRYPLKFSHISSTFSLNRMHPVLKRKRPHKGVDLAAPIGQPIYAVGDGRISSIGRHNGYGNMIKIAHNKTYTTLYAHMLKFQKGLVVGSRVKRGQIIGYVGQTGLATGPHCHFEFHIGNQPKNPTTIDLPRAAPIASREFASFKANSGAIIARMKLFEDSNLASISTKKPPVG